MGQSRSHLVLQRAPIYRQNGTLVNYFETLVMFGGQACDVYQDDHLPRIDLQILENIPKTLWLMKDPHSNWEEIQVEGVHELNC